MKVALCLYGKVGFKDGKADRSGNESEEILIAAHKSYKRNLFEKYDVDVYLHSWSLSLESQIKALYKPKRALFEKQRTFSAKESGERSFIYSRFYSAYQSAHLLECDYDLVIMSRFDIDWLIQDLSQLDVSKFNVAHYCGYGSNKTDEFLWGKWRNKKRAFHDASKLDHFHYDVENYGIFDHWFASPPQDMLTFSDLHLNMEAIKKNAKRNSQGVMNPHLMILYHLKETGLFDKLNFTHHYLDTPLIRRSVFGGYA